MHSYRISDRGGGIPHENMPKIFHYGYTTGDGAEAHDDNRGLFGQFVESRAAGTMHGYVQRTRLVRVALDVVIVNVCINFMV